MVASINRLAVEDERLHVHLFGVDRVAFPKALRNGLVELQDGRCFYCRDDLRSRIEVDHFLPWSRWPTNAIENLVVADRCNNAKRDHLAAGCHVEAWATRVELRGAHLVELAHRAGWESDPARSLALVRSCYAHLPAETPLWVGADRFVAAEPWSIATLLASVTIPWRSPAATPRRARRGGTPS